LCLCVCVCVCVCVCCIQPTSLLTSWQIITKHITFKKAGVNLRILPQHDRHFYALDPTDIWLVSTKFCLTIFRASQIFTKSCIDTLQKVLDKSYTHPTEFSKRLSDNIKLLLCQVCGIFVVYLQTFFASWCWLIL